MICAIYARKSTEQHGVNEEEKSVTRQIEHATAYAVAKGWTVSEAHIYVDDGISGAEFVKRPGFIRLMSALKPTAPFDVLVMSEESRLGREQIQTAYALQQITDARVRVFYYLTDQERKLDTAMDKMMVSLTNFGAELEREKASQRVHDALRKKALAGHVVCGKVYGYDNKDVLGADGQRLHVIRVINPEEATILRRIFNRYVAGAGGLASIAKELNAQGIPPPRAHRRGWAPTCLRDMLRRPIYRGVVIWNKTQSIHRNGTQTVRRRPEKDWLRVEAPELRIIPDALAHKVDVKIAQHAVLYRRKPDGKLISSPNGALMRSAYLLSGLAQCGVCGGSLVSYKRKKKDGLDKYICVFHHLRGPTICANSLRISQTTLDSAVLHGLSSVLDERMIAEAVRRALVEIRAGHTTFPDQRLALERQLSLVEARIRFFVDAVGAGKLTDSLYDELVTEEAAKKALVVQLEDLDALMRTTSLDAKRIERTLRTKVTNLKAFMLAHPAQARPMLQRVIRGRIVCTPFDGGYTIKATGSYEGLFPPANEGGGEGGI